MKTGRKVLFVGVFLAAILAIAVIIANGGYNNGYAKGVAVARADSWDRELSWRKAMTEIGQNIGGSPVRISVVFLDPQATFGNTPGDVVIGVFRDSGENRFTRYTIQSSSVKTERYADEWGKQPLGPTVTSY